MAILWITNIKILSTLKKNMKEVRERNLKKMVRVRNLKKMARVRNLKKMVKAEIALEETVKAEMATEKIETVSIKMAIAKMETVKEEETDNATFKPDMSL